MERGSVVGRDDDLAALERARTDSRGVLITGDRGIGKSTLLDEFLRRTTAGTAVTQVVATEAARSIPFGALAPLLPSLPTTSVAPIQMVKIAADAIRDPSAAVPVVLGIDDVDLLDDASATVVDQLVRGGDVTLVATHSSGPTTPGWLAQLDQLGHVRRHRLGPLGLDATRRLVADAIGGLVVETANEELWRLGAGNPLFVRRLALDAASSGALIVRDGEWIAQGRLAPGGQLAELLDAQLDGLDDEARDLLEVLALGGVVEFALVESLGDTDTLDVLEARDLMTVDSSAARLTARLSHPLLAARIEAATTVTRKRHTYRRLADWVTATGARRGGDGLRVATWELHSGNTTRPELAVEAARRVVAGADPGLAERLCRAALSAGGGFEARLTLARSLFDQGRLDEADDGFRVAQEEATTDADRARAAVARAEVLARSRGDLSTAIDIVTATADTVDDAGSVDWLTVAMAQYAVSAGDPAEAIRMTERLAERDISADTAVRGLLTSSHALVLYGRYDEACEHTRRGVRMVDDGPPDPLFRRDRLLITEVSAHYLAGRLDEAASIGEAGHRAALESGQPLLADFWLANRGSVALAAGDVAGARAFFDETIAALNARDPLNRLTPVLVASAPVDAHASDLAAVDGALARMDPHVLEADVSLQIRVGQVQAWRRALEGDTEGAARDALTTARSAADRHIYSAAVRVLHDAVRFGHGWVVVDELGELDGRVDGPLPRAYERHARAVATDDGGALDAVADEFATIGANLLAAEAACQAAAVHDAAKEDQRASRSRARADALLARCPGAATPAIRDRHPVLTARQEQIARLACHHTNAEIATILTISVRTVESHLHTVFYTLGIESRSELHDVFGVGSLGPADG